MGSAPKPDKQMGRAAIMSAETGRDMLDWMQKQAEVTNQWAAEDRDRFKTVFEPMQDRFIEDAAAYDSPERAESRANAAEADVRQQARMARDQDTRRLAAYGVRPDSGRFSEASRRSGNSEALAAAGARTMSRRATEREGLAMRGEAINLGQGLGVNPATSMGLSNQAGAQGFNGAMRGYGQQANILNADYRGRMEGYNSQLQGVASLAGAAGMAMGYWSSEDMKTEKEQIPEGEALGAVREMPVETWRYKDGQGTDGGTDRHVGPYAEDFTEETGQGNGKMIQVQDAIGVALGAIKDLDAKVSRLEGAMAA